ncbi:ankryin [Piscirickettsia litoralis]|uniref:Ankryin n=1 Tax=Piscirickettsia litoralis TaxID=1891921 RepID=A0ABX3A253_9GAMM|nr:ankryin [Piscirickettsia litoralis]ODN42949.1 ankryin [Piscirickettsia litoralis]
MSQVARDTQESFEFLLKLAKSNKGPALKKFIEEHKSLLKQRGEDQLTPLQLAVCSGSIETALIFMQYGGLAALRAKFYSQKNKSSIVHYCLARGWDVVSSESSNLPFGAFVQAAAPLMGERLFALRDIYGINPLGVAVFSGQESATKFFLELEFCKTTMVKHEYDLVNKLREGR